MIQVTTIPIERIEAGNRFRKDFGDLTQLAESIQKHGIIQPLAVEQREDGTTLLLAGERRLRAAKLAGCIEVPIRVYEAGTISELERRAIELAENIHRKDMTWQESVKLTEEVHRLQMEAHGQRHGRANPEGWSQGETAKMLGVSRTKVTEDLKMAEALRVAPDLVDQEDRTMARKTLSRFKRDLENASIAATVLAEIESKPPDDRKREIIESYIVGDFFAESKHIPHNSIHFIEIDPPYAINIDEYRESRSKGGLTSTTDHLNYNEVDASDYCHFLDRTLQEAQHLLAPDGWLIFWFSPYPWYDAVYSRLEKYNLHPSRMPGCWCKTHSSTMQPDKVLASSYELFFYCHGRNATIKKMGRANRFDFPRVHSNKRIHPTERPIELIEELIDTFVQPGKNALVPFAGSGNTILACANKGLKVKGFDLSEEYRDGFIRRVEEHGSGPFCSY